MSTPTPQQAADAFASFQAQRAGGAFDVKEVGSGMVEGGVFNVEPWHFALTDSHVTGQLNTIEDIRRAYPLVLSPTEIRPLHAPDGSPTPFKATFRVMDNKPLGVVGDRYGDFQNETLAQLAVDLVDASGGSIACAVSTHNGARVFFVVRVPKTVRIAGFDDQTMELNVIAANSHDTSSKLRIFPSPMCPQCFNGYRLALRFSTQMLTGMYEVRHTQSITARVSEVRAALGMSFTYMEALTYTAGELAAKPVSDADFQAFLDKLTPVPDKEREPRAHTNATTRRAKITSIYRDTPYLDSSRGTRWGVFQAVSEYADHHSQFKNTAKASKEESRFETLMNGHPLPQRALALLS